MRTRLVFSLKTKFVFTAAVIVAISSFTVGRWFLHVEERNLSGKLESDGRLLLTSMKVPIINAIINEELVSHEARDFLDNLLEEIVDNREYKTVYAFITDQHGKVIAHNRPMEYGKVHNDPFTLAALSGNKYRSMKVHGEDDGNSVLHMALPLNIYGKSWGALRVGFSLAPLKAKLDAMKRTIWSFSALIFLMGTTIFYIIGLTMTRPLKQLSTAMADVTHETLDASLPGQRRDEIGLLQRSFSAMIDRLKQSEAERQRAVLSMVQNEKLALTGKLVAGVAHEVNNPLVAISSCLYNLEQGASEKTQADIDTLKQGFFRIQNIVKQLSDFSHAGNLALQPVRSDLFFHEAASFAGMALKKYSLTLKAVDMCISPVVLPMDKGKLHQVVLDILINAADASPPHGIIEFSTFRRGGHYCFSVKDEGEGVPDAAREKIFEIFYTTKPSGKGSGIGLAICKTIVDMHHGAILLDSRPGETVFTVMIPINGEGHNEQD